MSFHTTVSQQLIALVLTNKLKITKTTKLLHYNCSMALWICPGQFTRKKHKICKCTQNNYMVTHTQQTGCRQNMLKTHKNQTNIHP